MNLVLSLQSAGQCIGFAAHHGGLPDEFFDISLHGRVVLEKLCAKLLDVFAQWVKQVVQLGNVAQSQVFALMAQGIVGNIAKLRAQCFHFALVLRLALLGGFGRSASFGGQRGARFAQCRAVFGKAECRNAVANE